MDGREAVTLDATLAADFAAMGAVLAVSAPNPDTAFGVRPDNWDSLCGWLATETQWRATSRKDGIVWLGLDYTAVDVVLRRLKLPDSVFSDLQLMEREALNIFVEALQ